MAAPQNIPQTMEPALDGENAGISRPSDAIGDGDGNNDNSTQDGSSSQAKCARDVATPLAHMPYDDQLEHKKNSIMQMLKKLVRNTFSASLYICKILYAAMWRLSKLNCYIFFWNRQEMHAKLVLMEFLFQNGFSDLEK
jgi:hypothetical protein